MKIKKKLILSSIFIIIALSFLLSLYLIFSLKPLTSEEQSVLKKIEVPDNTTVKGVASILKNEKLIRDEKVFYLAARFPFVTSLFGFEFQKLNLKSGVYNIKSSMSISEIFKILSSGIQDYIIVSIPEGLTISKIAKKLEEYNVCSKEKFIEESKNPELLSKFDIHSDSFEGYLFPDTYFFTPKMDAQIVISEMTKNLMNHLKDIPEYNSLSKEELNQKIILASIIEREYRIKEEAPLISSVFTNRLKINMGLYSCATIEYIITEIEQKPHPDVITYEDLKIDSPYNTYKWAGLPPGAISNPGLVALTASVRPEKTNYYYFTLVDPQKGRHVFSKDFQTHINKGYSAKTK